MIFTQSCFGCPFNSFRGRRKKCILFACFLHAFCVDMSHVQNWTGRCTVYQHTNRLKTDGNAWFEQKTNWYKRRYVSERLFLLSKTYFLTLFCGQRVLVSMLEKRRLILRLPLVNHGFKKVFSLHLERERLGPVQGFRFRRSSTRCGASQGGYCTDKGGIRGDKIF